MKKATFYRNFKDSYIFYVLGFILLIGIWQLVSFVLNTRTVPSPIDVFNSFIEILYKTPFLKASLGTNSILPHLFATAGRTLIATILGTIVGILFGLVLGWSKKMGYFFEVPIELFRAVPPLAYLPFLSLWFGPTNLAIFLLVFLGTFFMLIVNTLSAINNVDPVYKSFARTLGASEKVIYRTVIMPAIIPELSGGVRVIIVYSWGITVAGELLGAKRGIGQALMTLTTYAAISQIIAITVWVGIIAIIFDRAYVELNNRLIKWKEK